jgi:hypothetical protein
MPAINFDKRKVSPLNIDFIDVRIRMDTAGKDLSDRHHEKASSAPLTGFTSASRRSARAFTRSKTNLAARSLSAARLAQR